MSDIRLILKVARILEQWDPIGVIDISGCRDEYDSYVEAVVKLLEADASREKLEAYFYNLEHKTIGCITPRRGWIVDKLLRLKASPAHDECRQISHDDSSKSLKD